MTEATAPSAKFYKIIGKNFGLFPYHLGLNTLAENKEEFNPSLECGPGGLYFTDAEHIFDYDTYGDTLCEISVPAGAQVVRFGDKWKADRIVIESMSPLWAVETFQRLPIANPDKRLSRASEKGHLDVVKFLVEKGADIHYSKDCPLRLAAQNGHLDVVKFLVEQGADIDAFNGGALRWAAADGRLDVIKFLVEQGADIYARGRSALVWAERKGHLDVVNFLVAAVAQDALKHKP